MGKFVQGEGWDRQEKTGLINNLTKDNQGLEWG
jgi:hypothetical protein